jgi:DNA topoisomerase I
VVAELKELLKDADELILATDEDREGESIGWHLLQVLKPKVPVSRIVFHEITPEAIREALEPREVDENLVRAQETRRILDRLVGYTVSPLLWKKIASGLSAGRVQSVAVRLLVSASASGAPSARGLLGPQGALAGEGRPLHGAARHRRRQAGRHRPGLRREHRAALIEGATSAARRGGGAKALRERLEGGVAGRETEEKPTVRRPAPPFTTSTLQQEANRKLRLSARDTMRIAQRLYEEGYITYMRTDSVHLSQQAITAARGRIRSLYGEEPT